MKRALKKKKKKKKVFGGHTKQSFKVHTDKFPHVISLE